MPPRALRSARSCLTFRWTNSWGLLACQIPTGLFRLFALRPSAVAILPTATGSRQDRLLDRRRGAGCCRGQLFPGRSLLRPAIPRVVLGMVSYASDDQPASPAIVLSGRLAPKHDREPRLLTLCCLLPEACFFRSGTPDCRGQAHNGPRASPARGNLTGVPEEEGGLKPPILVTIAPATSRHPV